MSTNDKLKNETANGTKPVLCEGLECPDCGGCMEQNDTTYSNVNTSRARIGQHTGNIYFCETCENHWLENFLNNSKLERWHG